MYCKWCQSVPCDSSRCKLQFKRSLIYIISDTGAYENIIVDHVGEKKNVGLIKLNRPKALNALKDDLMNEVALALDDFEADKNVGAIVVTGSEKAFAGE